MIPNDAKGLMSLILCNGVNKGPPTAQKVKFLIKDILSKCDYIQIWSNLLKRSLMKNFIFCAVRLVFSLKDLQKIIFLTII